MVRCTTSHWSLQEVRQWRLHSSSVWFLALTAYGLPEQRRDTHYFTSLGGRLRYVNVLAIDAVVGTLEECNKHVLLLCRVRFSHEA